MNIVIRTDASVEIGTGHVMRCLTLANKLINNGAEVIFICRDLPGNSISYIRNQGIKVVILKDNYTFTSQKFLQSFKHKPDLLIVDQYELDFNWESVMRPFVKKIMVIDDLANRKHDCDLLLDQNYLLNYRNRYKGLVPIECKQLLGPNYLLLRDEFKKSKRSMKFNSGKVKNILVFFGGSDPTNETEKTILALEEIIDLYEFCLHVVVGKSNPNKEKIESLCNKLNNTYFYCQVNNISELMVNADLAIGAAGTTTWERCYLSLPSIVIVIAENQIEIAKSVADKEAIINLGFYDTVFKNDISDAVSDVLNNINKLKELSYNCSLIINSEIVDTFLLIDEIHLLNNN